VAATKGKPQTTKRGGRPVGIAFLGGRCRFDVSNSGEASLKTGRD